MRPSKLIIQAFGPYSGHEEIDFSELASKGLFLICGETGSGKTMILDAMTFALFGMSSGNTRDDFMSLRSKGSDNSTDTVVRFEFEHDGTMYAFERRLEFKRKNFTPSQNAYVLEDENLWRPLFENGKAADLKAKAVELIGLDYDQFRQVIILPQGQFEKLLVSNSEEKEKILSRIFGVSKWQRIADIMFDNAKKRYDELKDIRDQIENRLKDDSCSNMEEFAALRENTKEQLSELEREYKEKDCEAEIRKLDSEIALADRFTALHNLELKLKDYDDKAELCAHQEQGLALAEKADTLRPLINARNEAKENGDSRQKLLTKAEAALESAVNDSNNAKACYDTLAAQNGEYEANKALKTTLETRLPDYEKLETCRTSAVNARETLETARKSLSKAEENRDRANESATDAYAKFMESDGEYRALLTRYTSDIVGSLASELTEGVPCPVCGSTSHPKKAQPASEPVSPSQLDAAKDERERLALEHNAALDSAAAAKSAFDECKDKHAAAVTAERLAAQALDTIRSAMVSGIDSKDELVHRIGELGTALKEYEKKLEDAQRKTTDTALRVSSCTTAVETAREELKNARKSYENAVQMLEEGIVAAGFTDEDELGRYLKTNEEKIKARQYVERFKAGRAQCSEAYEEAAHALEGRQEPDAAACREQKNELLNFRDKYIGEKSRLSSELKRLDKKRDSLKSLQATFDAGWNRAENDMVLARNLRGDTGIGLQRYVLGIMFRSVIREANRMLEHVHGGRYRLYTTDEKVKGSNKRGLDLKVEDMYHNDAEGRAVTTLSGGEKFLVSLALSIGMSSIAATGGIHIEAMFIDEGFGSLDSDSIEDAIEVLNTIRSANGMVGIISHVQLLRDTVPTKLVVHKSRTGSTVTGEIG